MNKQEYKTRFINEMMLLGVDKDVAENEHDAWVESFPDCYSDADPEYDAQTAISYWEE